AAGAPVRQDPGADGTWSPSARRGNGGRVEGPGSPTSPASEMAVAWWTQPGGRLPPPGVEGRERCQPLGQEGSPRRGVTPWGQRRSGDLFLFLGRGSRTVNRLPLPGSLATSIVPPCAWTIPRLTERPSPVPFTAGFVVKNGSKIRARLASGMPVPVSANSILIASSCGAAVTVTVRVPPCGIAS